MQLLFFKQGLTTEGELSDSNYFLRESFAHLAAEVLPEILSELCAKCSYPVLTQMLSALEHLYSSDRRYCYTQIFSWTRRLIFSYPIEYRRELIEVFFTLLIIEKDSVRNNFPDPVSLGLV